MIAATVHSNTTAMDRPWSDVYFFSTLSTRRGSVGRGGGKAQPTDLRGAHRSHPQIAQRLNFHRMPLSPPELAVNTRPPSLRQTCSRRTSRAHKNVVVEFASEVSATVHMEMVQCL